MRLLEIKQRFVGKKEALIYVALGVATFYLSMLFSKDWGRYQFEFDTIIQNADWFVFIKNVNIFSESLYQVPAKFFGHVIGFSSFIFMTTVILLTYKLHFLKKITQSAYVGCFFYICFYLFLFEGTVLRAGYAVAFIMAAIYFVKVEKLLAAFLLILLASQIHFTAIVFLLLLPLYLFRSLNKVVLIICLLSPLMIVFDASIADLIQEVVSVLKPKYLFYFDQKRVASQNSTGLFFYFIVFFASLLSVVFYYLKARIQSDRFVQALFSLALCGIIAMCGFHDVVVVAARLGELLLVPVVILLSYLYMHFFLNKMRIHQTALMCLSLAYFLARTVYLYPEMFTG